MGCLANFISPEKLLKSSDLEECDIIEFNRLTYSHFGFYIGNGICINVTGPSTQSSSFSSSSSSCSNKFPKGMKQAELLIDIAGPDTRYNKVRINNCILISTTLGLRKRRKADAIRSAINGLQVDEDGKVLLNRPIDYNYNLLHNNCEYFATRCKYVGNGFSIQADNPTMGSTLGTVERVTSAVRHDLAEVIMDDDKDIGTRAAAGVSYAGQTVAGWSAYGVKTATDVVAGGTRAVTGLFTKLF